MELGYIVVVSGQDDDFRGSYQGTKTKRRRVKEKVQRLLTLQFLF